MTTYVLRTGSASLDKLAMLGRLCWPTTEPLLRRAGFGPGISCLDVGCGSGQVTFRLAEIAGPGVPVTGVDADAELVGAAREQGRLRGSHAHFRALAAEELDEHDEYGLVYSRFMLSAASDPISATERLVEATVPGGHVVVEDLHFAGAWCSPPNDAFDRYLELSEALCRHRGGEPGIGPLLPHLLRDAGLEDVEVDAVVPVFTEGEGLDLARTALASVAHEVVAAGIASEDEVSSVCSRLAAFAAEPFALMSMPRIVSAWGRKPLDAA